MSKTHLKSLLQNYSSIYSEEIASKEKMLKFLDESQDPFNKNLQSQLNKNIVNSVGLGYKERGAKPIIIGETTSDDVGESKSIDYGHFTASAFLLNHDKTKFLLTHHKKLNKWLQLGGHCKSDNDILAEAIREAREESGINEIEIISDQIFDIDVHYIPERPNEPAHYHYDIRFLLKTVNNDNFIKNDESQELKWFSFAGYPWLDIELERSVTRMIEKFKN
ncbi:MAG TPA: palindromic element RPE2 domain-containing protein [Rickettsia endosymbiont of Pyrocoelia pectoralis]|nr:palindromic element RPE2 domain-containing protein [Rickettsia endosymbiont of Pyrocoelia pectoralis]